MSFHDNFLALQSRKIISIFIVFILDFVLNSCVIFDDSSTLTEVESNIYTMNLLQSNFKKERGNFSNNFRELKTNFSDKTKHYFYSTKIYEHDWVQNSANPRIIGLKTYIGLVHSYKNKANKINTSSSLCVSKGVDKLNSVISKRKFAMVDSHPSCPDNYIFVQDSLQELGRY